jgi:hypothetical protein
MKIPFLQRGPIADKSGNLTPNWEGTLNELFTQLQQNVSEEGFVMPSQSTSNIARLTQSQNGTVVYDNDTHEMKVNINGTWRVVQVV